MDKLKPKVYNMPKHVKVLGKVFRIEDLKEDEHTDADGITIIDEQLIGVRRKPGLAYEQDTLLHETIHAIDENLFLKMTERQVSNLATVLLQVLKDNPEYTQWLIQPEQGPQ